VNQPAVQFLGQPHVWCGLSPSSSFSPSIPFSRQAQATGGVRARTAWQAGGRRRAGADGAPPFPAGRALGWQDGFKRARAASRDGRELGSILILGRHSGGGAIGRFQAGAAGVAGGRVR
jgi:hypothetical protein